MKEIERIIVNSMMIAVPFSVLRAHVSRDLFHLREGRKVALCLQVS